MEQLELASVLAYRHEVVSVNTTYHPCLRGHAIKLDYESDQLGGKYSNRLFSLLVNLRSVASYLEFR